MSQTHSFALHLGSHLNKSIYENTKSAASQLLGAPNGIVFRLRITNRSAIHKTTDTKTSHGEILGWVDRATIGSSMENDRSLEVQQNACEGYSSVEKLIVDVVYVDDDPLFCQIVGRELGKTSLKYHCFEDITDAIRFLQTHQTRTLISDYRMPKMSGIEFLRETCHLISDVNVFIASASRLPQPIEIEVQNLGARFVLKDRFIQSGYIEKLCTNAV